MSERYFTYRGRKMDIYSREGCEILARLWTRSGWQNRFSYNIKWLGMPVIQLPEDLLVLQELIHAVRPDWIIETGTAHGGSAVFYASILELLGRGQVLSVDVAIRGYNRRAIESHRLGRRIRLIESSSVLPSTIKVVQRHLRRNDRVMVMLDSNHTRAHVLRELGLYSKLVTPGSYLVVFDGVMEWVADAPQGKPAWRKDNPTAAIRAFLKRHPNFEVDTHYDRLGVTYCPGGFLKKKLI
ncbi:class I SAM-dependent methyltransferase [bacterium]|nr:class I SAM-dependent methyltransferase [bacterium]